MAPTPSSLTRSLALFSLSPVSHGFFQDDFRCLIGGLPARSAGALPLLPPLLLLHKTDADGRTDGRGAALEGEERVQVALNVLRLRNHFSKRTYHSAAEMWRETGREGPFKAQGTEQARELTCARRTNINRKELHNAERTKKLLYEQWVGWRVSIRLAITARLRGFTTIFPSFVRESSD